MTTYSSRNLPVVPGDLYDFRLEDAYVLGTQEIPPPTMWPMGEIDFNDGTRMLVPQPVTWKTEQLDPHTIVVSAIPKITDPWDDGLSFTGVMDALSNQPQSHAKGRNHVGGGGIWAMASLFLGLVLIGLSLVTWFVILPLEGIR